LQPFTRHSQDARKTPARIRKILVIFNMNFVNGIKIKKAI